MAFFDRKEYNDAMKITNILWLVIFSILGIVIIINNIQAPEVTTLSSFDPRNAMYTIGGNQVTLSQGISELSIPNSSAKIITRYFGNEVTGDLTNDSRNDSAFLISQETGGSGAFYYAVVAIATDTGYTLTNAFFIGDRIAPQTTEIHSGKLYVNYAERKSGEPMTTRPSVGVTKYLEINSSQKLVETIKK